MKTGFVTRLGKLPGSGLATENLEVIGTSSNEDYGKRDAASEVSRGDYDVIYVVKVIAKVVRPAQVEE